MFFKDIKPDSNIYVYNRQDNVLKVAKVNSVSPPHLNTNNSFNGQIPQSYDYTMYVDIVLDIDGKITPPYVCPEKSEIVYANNTVLCPDIVPIIREVESAKNTAEQQLSQREALEEKVRRCDAILAEYNPVFREKKENDKRFTAIENSVGRLEQMFSQFMNEWSGGNKNK